MIEIALLCQACMQNESKARRDRSVPHYMFQIHAA